MTNLYRPEFEAALRLHPEADMAYLERRIREETGGDHGVEDIAES